MEGVVKGIQADMTKLAKSHTHTSNTVSKLLDKSRKLSVTMKEVSERIAPVTAVSKPTVLKTCGGHVAGS